MSKMYNENLIMFMSVESAFLIAGDLQLFQLHT